MKFFLLVKPFENFLKRKIDYNTRIVGEKRVRSCLYIEGLLLAKKELGSI